MNEIQKKKPYNEYLYKSKRDRKKAGRRTDEILLALVFFFC